MPQTNTDKIAELAFAQDSNCLVYERIDAARRREINIAIIDRVPPTLKAVHEQFRLADIGIGYHAFYRYARRIRAEAALFQTAAATLGPEADLPALLPRALAQQLLETLAFEKPSPRHIQRLTESYRAAVTALAIIRRQNLLRPRPPKNGKRKRGTTAESPDSIDDLASLLGEYRNLVEREEQLNTSEKKGE